MVALFQSVLIAFLVPGFFPGSLHASLPGRIRLPVMRDGAPQPDRGPATPAPRRIFGIGVAFDHIGNAQGVPLSMILPRSPAERAGLRVGTVIAEINGEATAGRTGDACAQIIRDAPGTILLKFYDPATLKLRSLTLEKESLAFP